jgi:hypothetical protein
MGVIRAHQVDLRRAPVPALLAALVFVATAASLHAQAPNPTSAANPFFGSVTVRTATDEALRLSLDEAIALGLKNNLGLKEAENGEKYIQGQKTEAVQEFLPTVTLTGDLGVHQINLAALGFGPGVVKMFAPLFPGGVLPSGLSFITRDDLTEGQLHLHQTLFSGPVIAAFKGAGAAERAAHFAKMSARGEVVQQVASAYLHSIAAASEVDNAKPTTPIWRASRLTSTNFGPASSYKPSSKPLSLHRTPLRRISSCSSARSASTLARRSFSPIRLPTVNSRCRAQKSFALSPTRIARTTRIFRIRLSNLKLFVPPIAANGCPASALTATTASARWAARGRTATSPRSEH